MNDTDTETVDLLEMQRDHHKLGTRKRELRVILDESEWIDRAEQAAEVYRHALELKADEDARRKSFNDAHKSRLAEHERLALIVAAKTEPRMVQVVDYGLVGPNEVVTVRIDTGEIIDRRTMTGREREVVTQQPLSFPDQGGEDPGPILHPFPNLDPEVYIAEIEACGIDDVARLRTDLDKWGDSPDDTQWRKMALDAIAVKLDELKVEPKAILGKKKIGTYLANVLKSDDADWLNSQWNLWQCVDEEEASRVSAIQTIQQRLSAISDEEPAESADDLPPEV